MDAIKIFVEGKSDLDSFEELFETILFRDGIVMNN